MNRRSFARCLAGLLPAWAIASAGARRSTEAVQSGRPDPHQAPPTDGLHPDFTLTNFVRHSGVQEAVAAAFRGSAGPVWLYGGRGLGKTHLLHAVGHGFKAAHPGAKVLALSALSFASDLAEEAQAGCAGSLVRRLGGLDVLLFDHTEWLSGDWSAQDVLVAILNAIGRRHGTVVIISKHLPGDIDGFLPELRARAQSGVCVGMHMPDLGARMAILRLKAAECGHDSLPDEIVHFLATRTSARGGVHYLETLLRRVLAAAEFTGRPVTLSFAKAVLNNAIDA